MMDQRVNRAADFSISGQSKQPTPAEGVELVTLFHDLCAVDRQKLVALAKRLKEAATLRPAND